MSNAPPTLADLLDRLSPGDAAEVERPCDYHLGRFMWALKREVAEAIEDLEQHVFWSVDWAAFERVPYSLEADHRYNAALLTWLGRWRIYPRTDRALRSLHLGVALTCIDRASRPEGRGDLCPIPWNPALPPKPSPPFFRARKLRPAKAPEYRPGEDLEAHRARMGWHYAHEALRDKMKKGADGFGDVALFVAAQEEMATRGGAPLGAKEYGELERRLLDPEPTGHAPKRGGRLYVHAAWTQCAAGGDYVAGAAHFGVNDVDADNTETFERQVRDTLEKCGLSRSPVGWEE